MKKQFDKVNILNTCYDIAKKAHGNTLDDCGIPYFLHPLAVADIASRKLEKLPNEESKEFLNFIIENYSHDFQVSYTFIDTVIQGIAFLHDVVEDTDLTLQDLLDKGVPQIIVDGVDGMTKRDDEKGGLKEYKKFIKRCKKNPFTRLVKMADLIHNTHVERIDWDNKDEVYLMKRTKKYFKSYAFLAGKINEEDFDCEPNCECKGTSNA